MADAWTTASLCNSPGLSTRGLDFITNFQREALPAIRLCVSLSFEAVTARILGEAKQHLPAPSLVCMSSSSNRLELSWIATPVCGANERPQCVPEVSSPQPVGRFRHRLAVTFIMASLDFSIIVDECHLDLWRGTGRLAQADDEEDFTNPEGFELQRRTIPTQLQPKNKAKGVGSGGRDVGG